MRIMRFAVFGVLLLVSILFVVRRVRAEVARATFELGRDLAPLADLLGERARVNVNGEHMWASSALTTVSMHEVLDRFEAHCRGNGVTGATWGDVPNSDKSHFAKLMTTETTSDPHSSLGVFRNERATEGAVLCFATAEEIPFKDRIRAFMSSHDLGDLGRLRYAYVRQENGTSHVLTMWSDDHLRLDKMSGTDGSEPGSDDPDLPRPIRSRRIVSASIDGTPYSVRGYASESGPADVLKAYTDEMTNRGWTEVRTPDEGVRGYIKEGSLITVGTEATEEGTVIGIAEMGADAHVAPGAR